MKVHGVDGLRVVDASVFPYVTNGNIYAPVMMVNWEFYDNQTVESAREFVEKARNGNPPAPTRGPKKLRTWKENSEVLAGFSDGLANEGVSAGPASLLGLSKLKDSKA